MIKYDAKIIQKFAQKLYSQASRIVAVWTFLGLIVGGFGGAAVDDGAPIVVGALVVGLLGYVLGQARAFILRMYAQLALCQVEIERNTKQ